MCDVLQLTEAKEHDSNDDKDVWETRVAAYKDAWKKCLSRMQVRFAMPGLILIMLSASDNLLQQDTVLQLQRSSAKEIVLEVQTSYTNTLLGLPHPEIPVISIISE